MQTSSPLSRFVRGTWALLATALAFALATFFVLFSLTSGSKGVEIAALIVLGLVGGGSARAFVRENFVAVVLFILVIAECALLSQSPEPWSRVWPVLIPANAIGVMVGNTVSEGLRESRPKVLRDVWVINGAQEQRTERAKTASLAALSLWDSAKSGCFRVERKDGLFEAMGNPVTGFIVHCAAHRQEEGEWRILGSIVGKAETEIWIPSGPAYAPSGVVVDLETAKAALLGFFHHRGPDPELTWTSDDQVLDLKFG